MYEILQEKDVFLIRISQIVDNLIDNNCSYSYVKKEYKSKK